MRRLPEVKELVLFRGGATYPTHRFWARRGRQYQWEHLKGLVEFIVM